MPKKTKVKEKKINSKKNTNELNEKQKNERFSFDEEIVIGLKRIDNSKSNLNKPKKNNKQTKEKSNQNKKGEVEIKSKHIQNYNLSSNSINNKNKIKSNKKNIAKKTNENKKNKVQIKKEELSKKRKKILVKITKIFILFGIICGGILFAFMSPIFNIKNVEVAGNLIVSSETIISLSNLKLEQNIFSYRTSKIKDLVKQNAYIDTVSINRKLPDKVVINIKERQTKFMIEYGNAYVYISNQGYILEISNQKANYPTITNYSTDEEQLKEGNRLCNEDLEKLNDVLKIMEAADNNDKNINSLITKIDIADKSNYILELKKEKKQVYLGNTSNLSTKMLWITTFLKEEKKNEGIIFMNFDLNTKQPYFRKKV